MWVRQEKPELKHAAFYSPWIPKKDQTFYRLCPVHPQPACWKQFNNREIHGKPVTPQLTVHPDISTTKRVHHIIWEIYTLLPFVHNLHTGQLRKPYHTYNLSSVHTYHLLPQSCYSKSTPWMYIHQLNTHGVPLFAVFKLSPVVGVVSLECSWLQPIPSFPSHIIP